MKQYDVIHSHFRQEFVDAVNASLSTGWELHGPMTTNTPIGGSVDYLQPIVKELTYLEVLALPKPTAAK